jgi:predicted porin
MRKVSVWSLLAIGAACGGEAAAQITVGKDGIKGDFGALQLQGNATVSVQGAVIDPVEAPPPPPAELDRTGGKVDASARFTLEYVSDNAWVVGIGAEVDTGNVDIADFERDELYIFVAADWGRIELGENDGPADTLSFHAPQVGLGQVRGDFARYSGSVALLSVYDSRDAAKVTYLSPPIEGFRFGASYSPEFEINGDDPIPTNRLVQQDVVELGAQYIVPVGEFVFGVSGAYVGGSSDPVTTRGDLESWGAGIEVRRDKLVIGAAYLDRGQSNLLLTQPSETEWNAGVGWYEESWSVAASFAETDDGSDTFTRAGIGAEYNFLDNYFVRADAVWLEAKPAAGVSRDGAVGIVELGIRF